MILDHDLSQTAAATQSQDLSHQPPSQPSRLPRLLPAIQPAIGKAGSEQHDPQKPKSYLRIALVSPFTDHQDRLEESTGPRFARPSNGQVNGYIKFNWPSRRPSIRSSMPEGPSRIMTDDFRSELIHFSTPSRSPSLSIIGPLPAQSMTANNGGLSPMMTEFSWSCASSPLLASAIPVPLQGMSMQMLAKNEPKMVPPQFGLQAKMDRMDRRLWDFCRFFSLLILSLKLSMASVGSSATV